MEALVGHWKFVGMEDHLAVMVVAVGGAMGDRSSHSIGVIVESSVGSWALRFLAKQPGSRSSKVASCFSIHGLV